MKEITCVCGREKQDPAKRFCAECGERHAQIMSQAHRRRGTGRRNIYNGRPTRHAKENRESR